MNGIIMPRWCKRKYTEGKSGDLHSHDEKDFRPLKKDVHAALSEGLLVADALFQRPAAGSYQVIADVGSMDGPARIKVLALGTHRERHGLPRHILLAKTRLTRQVVNHLAVHLLARVVHAG